MRRPTSATTATSGSRTGTGSAMSTTAGRSCTDPWTRSTPSGKTTEAQGGGPWLHARRPAHTRSRPRCAGPRTPRIGRPAGRYKTLLAGIGRLLVEMDGAPAPRRRWARSSAPTPSGWASRLIDLVGPAATLSHGADGAIGDGIIEFGHRYAQISATPGGTVEVFRTIIAQHDLGLPRPDYPGRKVFLTGERQGTAAA